MPINLDQIKKLRELTKAGIMDCRRALEESNGDFNKAKAWLTKKGAMVAAKKADRETKAGIVEAYVHSDGCLGALVKLSCETDFVARNKEFKKLAHELAMQVAAMSPESVGELLKQEYIRDPKKKIEDLIKEAIGKLKENIKVEDFARIEV